MIKFIKRIIFFAVTFMMAVTVNTLGGVKKASAQSHSPGTNIINNGTVYFISPNEIKRPYTSAGDFLSYKINSWTNVVPASSEDLALPTGAYIPPQEGSLINDHGTVYLITNGQRAGFTSESAFSGEGYSFANVEDGDTSFLPNAPLIQNVLAAHRPGTLVNQSGTIYLIGSSGKMGIPSPDVLNSWGYSFAGVVPANSMDVQLPYSGLMLGFTPGQLSPTNSNAVSISLASNNSIDKDADHDSDTSSKSSTGSSGGGSSGSSGTGSSGSGSGSSFGLNGSSGSGSGGGVTVISPGGSGGSSGGSGGSSGSGGSTITSSTTTTFSFAPTTDLSTLTGNNTSAANSFTTSSNNNAGAGNVSNVSVKTLLYPGSTTKVLADVMPWWGMKSHISIGYNSDSQAQAEKQIESMISRGIDGAIITWYGPNNSQDTATADFFAAAASHPGFKVGLLIDHGAIAWDSCYSKCSATQAAINLINSAAKTYFNKPNYLSVNGRPYLAFFDFDLNYTLDWKSITSQISGNPLLIFAHDAGFSHQYSAGSYAWVQPSASNSGLGYLSKFYTTAQTSPNSTAFGAAYKGFNDLLASWSKGRVINQQCGQVLLNTFSAVSSAYSSSNQLPYLKLETWNDYEEGTELETGIDNCWSVAASITGQTVNWKLQSTNSAATLKTVDHFVVYLGDGNGKLQVLADNLPVAQNSYDLPANLNGKWKIYIQAVGAPLMLNKTSAPVDYSN